jgi:hypothetical protein
MSAAASAMYARNVSSLLLYLVKDGELALDPDDELQAGVIITRDGAVVHPALAPPSSATTPATTPAADAEPAESGPAESGPAESGPEPADSGPGGPGPETGPDGTGELARSAEGDGQ